ncbi:MAG: hypothetical protein OJF50_003216 [Nitrospira sp.]|nr:hypothetical protein [Nitrospira sp.]
MICKRILGNLGFIVYAVDGSRASYHNPSSHTLKTGATFHFIEQRAPD